MPERQCRVNRYSRKFHHGRPDFRVADQPAIARLNPRCHPEKRRLSTKKERLPS